jgi:preprotein translocase subunit SecD
MMNLHDELDRLASTSHVRVDVDRILVKARRRQVTGVAVVACAALLVAAVVIVPSVRRLGAVRPAGPPSVQVTVTVDGAVDQPTLDGVRQTLLNRARTAGLRNADVTLVDDRTFVFTASSGTKEQVAALIRPGELRIRRILASIANDASTVPVPPSGKAIPTLATVIAKLGPAYDAVQRLHEQAPVDADTLARLAPFRQLSADEVSVLPPETQYLVPTITCAQLNARRADSASRVDEHVAACDREGSTKFLLDLASVTSADVARTQVGRQDDGWAVKLTFTPAGQPHWTELTRIASSADEQHNSVAFTLDSVVVSSPHVLSEITGGAEMASYTRADALVYAALLTPPPLAVALTVD